MMERFVSTAFAFLIHKMKTSIMPTSLGCYKDSACGTLWHIMFIEQILPISMSLLLSLSQPNQKQGSWVRSCLSSSHAIKI